MSTLLLKISEGCQEAYVEFYVDRENLGERVKAALGGDGFDDVLPWFGGDYTIDQTVLGERMRRDGGESAILFACGCGYFGCSNVSASVVVSGTSLTLRDLFTWRGGRKVFAPIEPITFDRTQFDDAVVQLEREIAAWHPPEKGNSGSIKCQ